MSDRLDVCWDHHSGVPVTGHLIPLLRGGFTHVSSEDSWVEQFSWYAWTPNHRTWYAKATISGQRVLLHRLITQAERHQLVDHEDWNGLNNLRTNLRIADKPQNAGNSQMRADNTSGYRGVCFHRASGTWHARFQHRGKVISLDYHRTPEEAARAYDTVVQQYRGEFGILNFPR